MGHNRIKMELIKKENARMLTFHKRKKSLLKKISEFSILCGVEACMIIFGPKQKNQPLKLDAVWPSNSDEVRKIIDRYMKTDRARRCYNISDYFSEKKKKLDVEISKFHKQIYEAKYPSWDIRLDTLSEDELRLLAAGLDIKIHVSEQKLKLFQENEIVNSMIDNQMVPMSENYKFQLPVCFGGRQSSYMIPSNINWIERNYYSGLQLWSYSNSMMMMGSNVNPSIDHQWQIQEENMRNQMGIMSSKMNNIPKLGSESYVNNSSSWWKWENAANEKSNMQFQTMLPQLQVPVPSLPCQMLPSNSQALVDKFNCKIGFPNQDQFT